MCGIPVKEIPFSYTSVEVVQDVVVSKKLQDVKIHVLGLPRLQHTEAHMESDGLHPVPYSIVFTKQLEEVCGAMGKSCYFSDSALIQVS